MASKVHRLEDGEGEATNTPNEENKWAPWISLANDSSSSSKVLDLRIGSNNDGSLLEVVALSTQEPRKSRRQESLDPVKWEAKWQFSGDDWNFAEFDITSTHVGDLEIIYTFGIQTLNFGFRTSIRDDHSRWGRPDVTPTGGGPNGLRPIQPKLVMNAKNNLELFVISHF